MYRYRVLSTGGSDEEMGRLHGEAFREDARAGMLEGGGTLILSAYDRWKGPGHNGIYQEGDTTWMVYHGYDSKEAGIPKLRIESLGWDTEGWPYLKSQIK